MTLYVIRFTFPEGFAWAGDYGGGLGLAPSVETAIHWSSRETAERILANGYGAMTPYGEVKELLDDRPARD